jgi:hypothetical protein
VEAGGGVPDLVAHVYVVEGACAIEERGEHDLIDSHFEDESFGHGWNFAHLEDLDFAKPVEEEGLNEYEDEDHRLKLAEEKSVHDVGEDEYIGPFYQKLWSFIEGIHLFHLFFFNLKAIVIPLPIKQLDKVVPDALHFDSNHW